MNIITGELDADDGGEDAAERLISEAEVITFLPLDEIIGEDENVFGEAFRFVQARYRIRDVYFSKKDEINNFENTAKQHINVLDEIPEDKKGSLYFYIKGKLLYYVDESEALKFLWRSDKHNVVLSLLLSVIKRRMCHDSENPDQVINQSIAHAKEAVHRSIRLDVTNIDGLCWSTLGDAYFTAYFMRGKWDDEDIGQSVLAYKRSGKDAKMIKSFEMIHNHAQAHMLGGYNAEAFAGFFTLGVQAFSLERQRPSLDVLDYVVQSNEVLSLFQSMHEAIEDQRKGMLLPSTSSPASRRIPQGRRHGNAVDVDIAASRLTSVELNPLYKRATMAKLKRGLNKRTAVIVEVLDLVAYEKEIPTAYVVRDSSRTYFVITVYGLREDAINKGDIVTILDPDFCSLDTEVLRFDSIRTHYKYLQVNGKDVPTADILPGSMYVELREC